MKEGFITVKENPKYVEQLCKTSSYHSDKILDKCIFEHKVFLAFYKFLYQDLQNHIMICKGDKIGPDYFFAEFEKNEIENETNKVFIEKFFHFQKYFDSTHLTKFLNDVKQEEFQYIIEKAWELLITDIQAYIEFVFSIELSEIITSSPSPFNKEIFYSLHSPTK